MAEAEGGDGQCVAISPDGRSLVGSASGTRLWDVGTGALRWRVATGCQKVTFSPDGRVLACAAGALVLLRSAADGRELRSLAGHQGSVQGLAFSPCGQFLVTGGSDSTVRLWDVEEGQELSVWRGHEARVEAVAFHPGGAMVASGGAQPGEVKLGDLTRMQEFTRVFEPALSGWSTPWRSRPAAARCWSSAPAGWSSRGTWPAAGPRSAASCR
ncbi:MAG: hypothetical protein U0797_17230 [Gemmataceae bacterium]